MNQTPRFKKDELKMPQENFGTQNIVDDRPSYFGVILSMLIIVLMAILGGLYAWSELILKNKTVEVPAATRPTAAENNEPESTTAEAQTETLGAMSPSDEVDAIESDLMSTPFEDEVFEAQIQNIESDIR
jgi:hypothetical protein